MKLNRFGFLVSSFGGIDLFVCVDKIGSVEGYIH